jgi:hypothetical protein
VDRSLASFLIFLMIEAASTSETSVNFIRPQHGATTQKTAFLYSPP